MNDKFLPRRFIFKEVLNWNSSYPAKRSKHISPDSWSSCRISKFVFFHLFHNFLRNLWRWSAETWLGNSG